MKECSVERVDWWKMFRLSINDLIPSLFVNTEVYQGLAVIFQTGIIGSRKRVSSYLAS